MILDRLRRLPGEPDSTFAAWLEESLQDLEPDPLFRRRLRGETLNRHVAQREGLARRPARRRMTPIGRAVLYASLLLASSSAVALGGAQTALPGDALYHVKTRVEELRLELVSASFRDDLALLSLEERLRELEVLAASGRWSLVPAAAAAVVVAEERAEALGARPDRSQMAGHAARLTDLLRVAPMAAQPGLERALAASSSSPVVDHQQPARSGPPVGRSRSSGSVGPPTANAGSSEATAAPAPRSSERGKTDRSPKPRKDERD